MFKFTILFALTYSNPLTCNINLPQLNEHTTKPDDKFLIALLKWGPTNQVYGFYETAQLAHILGRVLVVSPMFAGAKSTASVGSKYLSSIRFPLNLRVDIEEISKNQPVVSLDTYNRICKETTTAFIYKTPREPQRIIEFQDATNFTFKKFDMLNKIGPVNDKNAWQPFIGIEDKCAVYVMPYRSIKNPEPDILTDKAVDFPPFIHKLADGFMTDLTLGVHWRYNKDWKMRCGKVNPPKECRILSELNPTLIAEVIFEHVESFSFTKEAKNYNIYISSPPDQNKFLKKVSDHLKQISKEKYRTFTTIELREWMMNHVPSACDTIQEYFEDVLSTVEQAILSKSISFLPWPSSSWSGRIIQLRKPRQLYFQNEFFSPKVLNETEYYLKTREVAKSERAWDLVELLSDAGDKFRDEDL